MLVLLADEPVDSSSVDSSNVVFLNERSDNETEVVSSAADGTDNNFDSNGILFLNQANYIYVSVSSFHLILCIVYYVSASNNSLKFVVRTIRS